MSVINQILSKKHTTGAIAMQVFDELESTTIEFMLGKWKGEELFTDHPMDGMLTGAGWYGKILENSESVHPLVFLADKDKKDLFAVNPAFVMGPFKKEVDWTNFLADARIELETTEFKARLRETKYRDTVSATMLYDELPINDIFKKIDEDTVLGVMDARYFPQPYFFLLRRDK